jgi:hypothetical protein
MVLFKEHRGLYIIFVEVIIQNILYTILYNDVYIN